MYEPWKFAGYSTILCDIGVIMNKHVSTKQAQKEEMQFICVINVKPININKVYLFKIFVQKLFYTWMKHCMIV